MENDMHVVIMFEYARPNESLTPSQQVNEVFGPFDSGEEADEWSKIAEGIIPDRHWLIIPLSEPRSINLANPLRN